MNSVILSCLLQYKLQNSLKTFTSCFVRKKQKNIFCPEPRCQCAGCWFALFPADTRFLIPLGAAAGELHVSVETTKWFIDSADAKVIEMHRGETGGGGGGGFGVQVLDEQWRVWLLNTAPPQNLADSP